MVYKGVGFIIGFVTFGNPVLRRAVAWLKRNIPNYMELAQPKKSVSQACFHYNADFN